MHKHAALLIPVLAVLLAAPSPSSAIRPAPPPADKKVESIEVKALLEAMRAAKTKADRDKVAAQLADGAATKVKDLEAFLQRDRGTNVSTRRGLLGAIKAAVPNKRGKFAAPRKHMNREELAVKDKKDWFAELAALSSRPGLDDVLADVAAIRALAASKVPRAAAVILDFAFTDKGLIYRDECGRYLRLMQPYSVPALIRATPLKDDNKRRYANYQLERVDRQSPVKAIESTSDEALKIEILQAFKETLYREAVYVVLDMTNHASEPLRKKAREVWMEYVAGREGRKPPKRRLLMPGGKFSKTVVPLYYGHRELAKVELRRRLEAATGNEPPETTPLVKMTEQLFAIYDRRREDEVTDKYNAGKASARAGRLADAAAFFDEVLALRPEFDGRADMAEIYLDYGKELAKSKDYDGAIVAFAKAAAVDPDGEHNKAADAALLLARGRAVAAAGGDAAAEFAAAREVDPSAGGGSKSSWMLMAGGGVAALGLIVVIIGFVRRRRY